MSPFHRFILLFSLVLLAYFSTLGESAEQGNDSSKSSSSEDNDAETTSTKENLVEEEQEKERKEEDGAEPISGKSEDEDTDEENGLKEDEADEEKSEKSQTLFPEEEMTQKTSEVEEKEDENKSGLPMLEKNEDDSEKDEEKAPKDTFAVWNTKGKICLLAKFSAVFAIKYSGRGGEEKAEVTLPETGGLAKGHCDVARNPLLEISWQKYVLSLMFNKTDTDSSVVTSIELTYDTSEHLFDGASNAGKVTARSKTISLFETPLDKSYYCPAQEVVKLYSGNKQVVTAKIGEIFLQAYGVEGANFSPVHRCNKVVIDEDVPFVQDETVPLAVGCTLALITLIILVGFSIHRAVNAAKVDYNSVP